MDDLRFEWDEHKNEINQKKHGISFSEAQTVFYDDDALYMPDPEHSNSARHRVSRGVGYVQQTLAFAFASQPFG